LVGLALVVMLLPLVLEPTGLGVLSLECVPVSLECVGLNYFGKSSRPLILIRLVNIFDVEPTELRETNYLGSV
jgi:hypothetical protein